MPTVSDYVNQLTFQSLQHPLQPLLDLAAKKEKDADEARQFKENVALLREKGAITAELHKDLQKSQQNFLEAQGDLDRKNKIAVVEAQSKALVDRLNEVDRAKLRAVHPQRKGESDESWIARVGEEQANQLNPLIGRMAKLRTESEQVRDAELKRRMTAATALARQDPLVIGTIDTLATKDDSVKKLKAKGASIEVIADNLRKNGKNTEAVNLENDFRNAVTAKLEGVDERSGRPFVPESPAAIEHLKQLNTEIGQVNQALDIGLRQPNFIGFGNLDFGPNLEKLPVPPGAPGAGAGATDRQKAIAAKLGVSAPGTTPGAEPRSFAQRALDVLSGAITGGAVKAAASDMTSEVGNQIGAAGLRFLGAGSGIGPVPGTMNREPIRAGRIAATAVLPATAAAIANPMLSPQILQRIAGIFGADAPDLLNDAGKIATSNGIDPQSQQQTLDAALGGDPQAQQQVATVLDYVRRQRTQPGPAGQLQGNPPLNTNTPAAPGAFPTFDPHALDLLPAR